jgi:hypothetical protein
MQGAISLGIRDHSGKLVRVLHRIAGPEEFFAALDGYITHWDGLDDAGQQMPHGQYSAGGFMIGPAVTVRAMTPPAITGSATPATLDGALPGLAFPNGKSFVPQPKIRASLIANPLVQGRPGSADLSVAFDGKGSWLQLADGLPLAQISSTPGLKWIALGRAAPGEPLIVFQSDGVTVEEFVITKISNMMAFDCGPFDL